MPQIARQRHHWNIGMGHRSPCRILDFRVRSTDENLQSFSVAGSRLIPRTR